MIQIRFWGGPKDGEVIHQNVAPFPELICYDAGVTVFDLIDFKKNILDNPKRTQQYHKYVLKETENKNVFYYMYSGSV